MAARRDLRPHDAPPRGTPGAAGPNDHARGRRTRHDGDQPQVRAHRAARVSASLWPGDPQHVHGSRPVLRTPARMPHAIVTTDIARRYEAVREATTTLSAPLA